MTEESQAEPTQVQIDLENLTPTDKGVAIASKMFTPLLLGFAQDTPEGERHFVFAGALLGLLGAMRHLFGDEVSAQVWNEVPPALDAMGGKPPEVH